MMDHWHGPQWVLATVMTLMLLVRAVFWPENRAAKKDQSLAEFAGHETAWMIDKVFLVAILWWGGFWS